MSSTSPPGLDLAALEVWFDGTVPGGRSGPLAATLLAGGKSNLTYRLSDGTSVWALRRPPLSHVLPTAHDMGREYRVIAALAATDLPIARPVALCADATVVGQPFYVMEFVVGSVLDDAALLATLDPGAARRVCELLADTLAAVHAVDFDAVGLRSFGRPDGYLARQISRWRRQWELSRTRDVPDLDAAARRLGETCPASQPATIVHGDYRLTNVMYAPDLTRIAAVVDWELSTLGDPLADVGLLAVYQHLSLVGAFDLPPLQVEDGFMSVAELVERYAQTSGRDLGDLNWYLAMAYFKLAVITEGIHHRYLEGKTVGTGFTDVGAAVPWLAAQALTALTRGLS